jgi:hypothetical protein
MKAMNSHTCSLQCDIGRGEIPYGIADAETREVLQKLSPAERQAEASFAMAATLA